MTSLATLSALEVHIGAGDGSSDVHHFGGLVRARLEAVLKFLKLVSGLLMVLGAGVAIALGQRRLVLSQSSDLVVLLQNHSHDVFVVQLFDPHLLRVAVGVQSASVHHFADGAFEVLLVQ